MRILVLIIIVAASSLFFKVIDVRILDKKHSCSEKEVHSCSLSELDYKELYRVDTTENQMFPTIKDHQIPDFFKANPSYLSDGFDFPVGKPNGVSYYKSQNFGDNRHLGEDWNGAGGGNTDFGDPIYAVGNGLVTFSKDVCCGWGKTVRIVHFLPYHQEYTLVESVYAHLNTSDVNPGDMIRRGQQIGTMGTANGRYKAHLHLEMRNFVSMSLGAGYGEDVFGYLTPTYFIQDNRPQQ